MRNISSNEKDILKLLSNSDFSISQIKNKYNMQIKNIPSLLNRMKKEDLIYNEFRKCWKITSFGKEIYKNLQ